MPTFVHEFPISTGETWKILSESFENNFICIPIHGLDGMSAELIGENVLDAIDLGRMCRAVQIAHRIHPELWKKVFQPEWLDILEEFEGCSARIDEALKIIRGQYIRPKGGFVPGKPYDPSGHVYLLKAGNYYKIGRTTDVSRRIIQLGLQLPWPATLVHSIPVSHMAWAERHLHAKFYSKRTNGEWFDLDDDDVRWICSLTQLEEEG